MVFQINFNSRLKDSYSFSRPFLLKSKSPPLSLPLHHPHIYAHTSPSSQRISALEVNFEVKKCAVDFSFTFGPKIASKAQIYDLYLSEVFDIFILYSHLKYIHKYQFVKKVAEIVSLKCIFCEY